MKIYKKAILPSGFLASGISAGIKRSGKPDLALLYSEVPAKASCKFTANKVQAAPIKVNKEHLKKNRLYRAVIVNSGNANCFTGKQGLKDAQETARELASAIGVKKESVLVCSTGIIGRRLPLNKIKRAIPQLARELSVAGIHQAKKAILTTDVFTKEMSVKFNSGKGMVSICGIAKGAGMIAPDMATMLVFILTDAAITQRALDKAMSICVDNSFNCITVDGCMSTNDTVIALANAASGSPAIDLDKNFRPFVAALSELCRELAKLLVRDAEGASKFIQIKVDKARNFSEAKRAALAIANSNLFKTAIYGENPNFGRIVSAVGASGVSFREEEIKIKVSPLEKKEIDVKVGLGRGKGSCTVYTCDLTPEYIKINAAYN